MIRLERSAVARLVSGARLQGLITFFALLIALRAIGQAVGAIDDTSLPIGGTLLILLALVVIVAVGAAGSAEADDTGVRWRYFVTQNHPWTEIEQVELRVVGVSLVGLRHLMFVRAGGRSHKVTPACGRSRDQFRFAADLLPLAARHGVAVVDGWGVTATRRPAG